jgi:hypothetical protein
MIEVDSAGTAQVVEDNGLGDQPKGDAMDLLPPNAVSQADIDAELAQVAEAPSDAPATV